MLFEILYMPHYSGLYILSSWAAIKVNDDLSDPANINKGGRRGGCLLSSYFFNVYLEWIVNV